MVTRPFTGNNNNLLSISILLKKVNRDDGTDNGSGIVDQSAGYFNHVLQWGYFGGYKPLTTLANGYHKKITGTQS